MKVTDNSSLTLTFPPDKGSAFVKYLTSSETIAFELKQKQPDEGLLSKFVPTGLSFSIPIKLGTTSDQLTLKAGLQTSVTMKTGSLFDPKKDDFGDSVSIPTGQVYLSLGFNATVDAGISEKMGDLKFGVNAGTGMVLTNYRLFNSTDKIAPALQTVFQDFVIPADLEDIESMVPNAVATVEGTGSLKFSATASYPVYSNPLATLASGPFKGFSAKAGGSLSLAVSASLTGGYQVRVRRLDAKKFELGYEKKRGTAFSVTAKAQFGVSAGMGDFDVIAQLLRSISKDPVVDKDTFSKQTGLTEEQISTMATAIKAAIDRSLEVAISEQLELSEGKTAAFSYEVDIQKIQNDDKARKAVHDALDGDLRGLERTDFNGVKRIRSVFTSVHEKKFTFKLNLLGIFNHGSVTDLLKKGMLIVDRDTGVMTIADKATASRVGFTSDNFAKNGAKLRALVASSVIMTAAYSVGGAIPQAASFSCGCWSFESHQKTNRKNIDRYLHELVALKLMSPEEAKSRQQSVASMADDFGPSTFLVNSSYDNSAFRGMFLLKDKKRKEQPRSQEDYENIGRAALTSLLPPGDPISDVRRRPLTEPKLWALLKPAGAASEIIAVLKTVGIDNVNISNDIVGDFDLIMWWADSMSRMAQAVAKLTEYLASNPTPDPQNNTFKKTRKHLDDSMASVVHDAKDRFGEPWGLLVMAETSGLKDSTTATVVNPHLAFSLARNPELSAPSVSHGG